MRILHIIDSLNMGGAENVLIGLSYGQRKQGHDVTIMPLICPAHTPVRERIEANSIIVQPFAVKGSWYNPKFICKIAKVLSKFDIVHVHLFPSLYWVGFAKILSFCKTPLVYTEHSTNNRRRNNPLFHYFDRLIYKNLYDMVIACADKVLDTYKEAFPTVSHVCAINNGVDISIYQNAIPYSKRELLGINEECFVITMVARFMTMKRQDTIVEAIAKLPSCIHALFVGGEERDEGLVRVKKIASDLGVLERINFLYIRKDVPRILKTSDVVIMASDYEGLSLSSIEGMAAGKPFVATNVNGLREVVGGAGLLFENKDADALTKIIYQLSTDKGLYQETARKCFLRAQEYDINAMVDSYLKVYGKMIKNKAN